MWERRLEDGVVFQALGRERRNVGVGVGPLAMQRARAFSLTLAAALLRSPLVPLFRILSLVV